MFERFTLQSAPTVALLAGALVVPATVDQFTVPPVIETFVAVITPASVTLQGADAGVT